MESTARANGQRHLIAGAWKTLIPRTPGSIPYEPRQ